MTTSVIHRFEAVDTLGDMVRFHAAVRPDALALRFEDRATTYGELDELSNQVANGLLQAGLTPGDRVAFLGRNSDVFFHVVLGCAKSGTVFVGLNWRLALPEIDVLVKDGQVRLLFVGAGFEEIGLALQQAGSVSQVIALAEGSAFPAFTVWRDRQSAADPGIDVSPADTAIQMYTSGTTGEPKGVELPHRNFFVMVRYPAHPDMVFQHWTEHDVSLLAMPAFHIGGVGWGIIGLRAGACTVIVREFEPSVVLDLLERHRITKLLLVPTAIRMLLQHPRSRQISYESLTHLTYAASPIPLTLLQEAVAVFRCGFVQLYGMTETTGGATYLPPDDHDPAGNERMRSAGKPLPGVRVKIVDGAGTALGSRAMGEICIDSPANMRGYSHRPAATAQTLIDGYVHTGDAGYLDEEGYVYVLDRVKDMIVSGAENIYPAEIENVLAKHPDVVECAVIGVPDDRWGEAVKAIVVKRPGAAVSADELIEFARAHIARYKLPKSVEFIDQLPRNPAGKVLRRSLRSPYWAGRSRAL